MISRCSGGPVNFPGSDHGLTPLSYRGYDHKNVDRFIVLQIDG